MQKVSSIDFMLSSRKIRSGVELKPQENNWVIREGREKILPIVEDKKSKIWISSVWKTRGF